VKEISVTKGSSRKKIRIMGRGRTGIGTIRKSHVNIKLEKIDCAQIAQKQLNPKVRAQWMKRYELVQQLRAAAITSSTGNA
jgi:hypothetical protein